MPKGQAPASSPQSSQGPRPQPANQQPLARGGVVLQKGSTPDSKREEPALHPGRILHIEGTELFKHETEADRIREAKSALHGPQIRIDDKIHLAIFEILNSLQAVFAIEERFKISEALAARIWEIIDYVDAHFETQQLRIDSINKAVTEAIEFEERGIAPSHAAAVQGRILQNIKRVLPPIKINPEDL